MSAASRVRPLPLLRSSLLARGGGSGCCSYSSVAAARSLPGRTAKCRPSSSSLSRGVGANAAGRAWRYEGVRLSSTDSSSTSSSAGSDDGASVASSQTSLGSEAGAGEEAQPAAPAFAFAFE